MRAKHERLATRLTRRLIWISAAVLIVNVAFVAIYDAGDDDALLGDAVSREVRYLDQAIRAASSDPLRIGALVRPHFAEYPEAYGYILVDARNNIIDSMNEELLPANLLGSPVQLEDWIARKAVLGEMETYASHVVVRPEGRYRVYYAMIGDPANLIRAEIMNEFFGYVLRPVIPTLVLLIGAVLLIIRRDLRPVAEAATWAREISPDKPSEFFQYADPPAEIKDLTDAVSRAVDRLNTELESEKRRAAEAAHALRTPVAVLVARLGNLPDDPALAPIRDDVKALSRTVTQYLLSSGADRMEIGEHDQVELNEVAEEAVKALAPLALTSGSEIIFMPDASAQHVQDNAEGVGLALTNLIENAVFHGGGGLVEVQVGPGPVINVSDTGPGLPPKAQEHLFKPFQGGARKGGRFILDIICLGKSFLIYKS